MFAVEVEGERHTSRLFADAHSRPLATVPAPHPHLFHALDELVDISEPLTEQFLLLLDAPLHAFLVRKARDTARVAESRSCGSGRWGGRGRGGAGDGRRTETRQVDALPRLVQT